MKLPGKKSLDSLPRSVIAKVERLARRTGKSPLQIVEDAIELYERLSRRIDAGGDELEELSRDPKTAPVIFKFRSLMAKRAAAKMTTEERAARAKAGGIARAANLTPERRIAIAKKAAKASASKRSEEAKQQ